MKFLIPLSTFQILGNACCLDLHREFLQKKFSQNWLCYDAKFLNEANFLVIWGSLSQKLLESLQESIYYLPEPNHILYISGCKNSHNNLANYLPVHDVYSKCILEQHDYKKLIKGARSCLKA